MREASCRGHPGLMDVRVLGIRHHGPGSARALVQVLDAWQPDRILVEGPADADSAIPLVADPGLRPPVALLVYPPDDPSRAGFWPFTSFSPEWQALRWALARDVPVGFMDLPLSVEAALPQEEKEGQDPETAAVLQALARSAGVDGHREWWDRLFEERPQAQDLFDAVHDAMAAVRDELGERPLREHQREAWMRRTMRRAKRAGATRLAVVCGALHAPALTARVTASADNATLKGLRQRRVTATWVPWTHTRLSLRSGYGAGCASPGWYHALWTRPDDAPARWLSQAARLLREAGQDTSPAHVLHGVRLADALATLRGRQTPGLGELQDAVQAVLCEGQPAPLALVREQLEVGEALGAVPDGAPTVPLQQDVTARQRRLRLKPSAEPRELDLDLRKPLGLDRSHLLHRLRVLGVPWGRPREGSAGSGTFRERWTLRWDPEFALRIIEANVWGNTLATAADARLADLAGRAQDLPTVVRGLDHALLAELPRASAALLQALADRAAAAPEVLELLSAVPELARTLRYGDVRRTPRERLGEVLEGLIARILAGLVAAASRVDDDAATALAEGMDGLDRALALLERDRARWHEVLARLVAREDAAPRVRGRACRVLLTSGQLDDRALEHQAALQLSPVVPLERGAAWLEGLLRGGAALLLHQRGLWRALDAWLVRLSEDDFVALLPVLRRSFADFRAAERRQMARTVARLEGSAVDPLQPDPPVLDPARADRVLPVLRQLVTRHAQ